MQMAPVRSVRSIIHIGYKFEGLHFTLGVVLLLDTWMSRQVIDTSDIECLVFVGVCLTDVSYLLYLDL